MLAGLPDSACCMPPSAEQAPVHQEAVNYFWAKTDSASPNAVQISHLRPVRLDLSSESAAIQQCFSLTTNQRTVFSAQ
jgi:hypothetical protein